MIIINSSKEFKAIMADIDFFNGVSGAFKEERDALGDSYLGYYLGIPIQLVVLSHRYKAERAMDAERKHSSQMAEIGEFMKSAKID